MSDEGLLCIECGYDLRGLAAEGKCPECGALIEQSRLGSPLAGYDPLKLVRLVDAMDLAIVASSLELLEQATILVWMLIPELGRDFVNHSAVYYAALITAWGSAWLLGTRLTPLTSGKRFALDLSNVLRGSALLYLAFVFVPLPNWRPGPFFHVAGLGAVVAAFIATLCYFLRLLRLGRMLPDARLVQHAPPMMIATIIGVFLSQGYPLFRRGSISGPEYTVLVVVLPVAVIIYRLIIFIHARRRFRQVLDESRNRIKSGAAVTALLER